MGRFETKNVLSVIGGIALIAGTVYWFTWFGPVADAPDDATPGKNYLAQGQLHAETASKADIERTLLEAYRANQLQEVSRFTNPHTNDVLVFAAPTISGSEEQIDCSIQGHRYCGLYYESNDDVQLLLWGTQMVGFSGVESFSDSDHAIIATAWSLFQFTSIDRKQLNIRTGELIPKLLMELDTSDTFAELQVSGDVGAIRVRVDGTKEKKSVRPNAIIVSSQEGIEYSRMTSEQLQRLQEALDRSEGTVAPIAVYPTQADIQTRSVHLALYGIPYRLDIGEHTLTE